MACSRTPSQLIIVCPDNYVGRYVVQCDPSLRDLPGENGALVVRLSDGGSSRLSKGDFEAFGEPHIVTFRERSGSPIASIVSIDQAGSASRWALQEGYEAIGHPDGHGGVVVDGQDGQYYGTIGKSARD